MQAPEAGAERRGRGPWLAALLLLGEFVWLVSHFTTATLPESEQDWVVLMKQAKYLPQIGLAVLTVLLLFRSVDTVEESPRAAWKPRPRRVLAALVLAQFAAFVLLELSTSGIFEEHLEGVQQPLLALALWAFLGLATTLLGVLLFVPWSELLRHLSKRAGMLLGVGVVGLTAWCAGYYAAHGLREPLRVPTLWLTDKLLGLFESDYTVDRAQFIILTPRYPVHIAPECSGFEGMGLMAVFATSYVWIFRRRLRFPQLLLLPLAGVVCAWLMNVLRIVALMLIGNHVSPDFADNGFHSLAGTFSFCIAALGLVLLSTRMNFFAVSEERKQSAGERDATAAYLTPFLLAVALGMIATALGSSVSAGVLLLPRVLLPACALWLFRRHYPISFPRQGWATPLVLGAVAFAIWIGVPELVTLRGASAAADTHELGALTSPGALWVSIRIAGSVCVVPLLEELAFRGYLMRRLTGLEFESVSARQISVLAWAISALLFGVLHEHWLAATIAGALYGYAYMRRGQLGDCVLAHAFTNLLLVVLALYTGDWSNV